VSFSILSETELLGAVISPIALELTPFVSVVVVLVVGVVVLVGVVALLLPSGNTTGAFTSVGALTSTFKLLSSLLLILVDGLLPESLVFLVSPSTLLLLSLFPIGPCELSTVALPIFVLPTLRVRALRSVPSKAFFARAVKSFLSPPPKRD